jgi:hypothetical protein
MIASASRFISSFFASHFARNAARTSGPPSRHTM